MKTTTLILFLFVQLTSFAQAPLEVTITDGCADASGTYLFTGLLNGKNNYNQTLIFNNLPITLGVGFDGVKWVLYVESDLTNPGFMNTNLNGLLPPLTGWVYGLPDGCDDGTMEISTTLANSNFDNAKTISLYPNPANDFIIFSMAEKTNSKFNYQITDTTSRIVRSGNSNFETQIDVNNLKSGTYLIQITAENGTKTTTKLLKR